MIRLTVLYPKTDTSRFDMAYYLGHHIPMVQARLGSAIKGAQIDEGLAGIAPGSPPAYSVIAQLVFESVETFQAAFAPHAEEIVGDIAKFSNVQPTIQLGTIKV